MAGPSGATARLALPYPVPNDTVDVPRDVQALAAKLDPGAVVFTRGTSGQALPAPSSAGKMFLDDTGQTWVDFGNVVLPAGYAVRSSTPPANPVNGQRWVYPWGAIPGYGNSTMLWEFEWSSTGRWYFTGGPPWQSSDYPNRTSFGTNGIANKIDLDNGSGAGFIVPFSGTYEFRTVYNWVITANGGTVLTGFGVDGTLGGTFCQTVTPGVAGAAVQVPLIGNSFLSVGNRLHLMGSTGIGQVANAAPYRSRVEVVPLYITP